jgi:hypothetical protein
MPKSWRDVLPIHPACAMFDPLPPDELRALAADIKAHGLRSLVSIIEDANGNPLLLDGRNRLDALALLGEEITLDNSFIFDRVPSDTDPYAYVVSANIRRRHLTAKAKRDLIAKLVKAAPEKSDRQIAAAVKSSHTTVATVRAKMEAKGDVAKLATSTDTKGRKQPRNRGKGTKPQRSLQLMTLDELDRLEGEIERLRTENEDLRAHKHRLELQIIGLKSDIEDLRRQIGKPDADGLGKLDADGLDIPHPCGGNLATDRCDEKATTSTSTSTTAT